MKANDLVEPVKEIRRAPANFGMVRLRGARPFVEEPEHVEGLAQKASHLAASHQVSATLTQGRLFVPHMIENVRQLLSAHQQCVAAASEQRRLSPATQCLVNNFEPVEKQLREISANLKPGADDGLPKLAGGPQAGYPRIYVIALSVIEDTDGCLDTGTLKRYFHAYQQTAPLNIGEVKSVRAMLRLAMIETLRRMAIRFVHALEEREAAIALSHRAERGIREEATVGKIINSLRWLSTFDVEEFFDSISLVEFILRKEPSGTYPLMEAATRANYCRAVANIARRTGLAEPAVAQRAIELVRKASSAPLNDQRRADVGYYLIDDGLVALESSLGYAPRMRERLSRVVRLHPTSFYLGLLVSFTIIITAPFIFYAAHLAASALALASLAVLLVVPVSDVVLSVLNTILSFKPTLLPKMDFSQGIPEEARAMVVVPAILSSETVVQELLGTIEAHYLSNQDRHIFFALITDWSDAAQESMPGDEVLLRSTMNGIEKLNERHQEGAQNRFYLFHRRRRWNQSQGKWIGWERKRGKLHEFNQLLRGAKETSYLSVTTDSGFLARVRYVITLDADTLLPRDAARRLIGTISHPLNRPQLDALTGRVGHGYGIIQPRISMLPPAAPRRSIPGLLNNRFKVSGYSPVVPNLYQDLFGDDNYIGKGLYEVDVFEAALENRVPENSLLSHDLFEGLYARTALASDIKVFDSPQSNYEAVAKRQHRWTRGDWQLWPWLLPRVPVEHGAATTTASNVLPVIARWKILDNLRRSLVQPLLLLWLIAAWTILPGSTLAWTLLVCLTIFAKLAFSVAPNFLLILRQAPPARPAERFKRFVRLGARECVSLVLQLLLSLTYLAHQSYLMLNAITRTLYRGAISGKHLLEWLTAAQVQRDSAISLRSSVRYMWAALVTAPGCGVLIFIVRPEALPIAAPILLAWAASPFVVHILNGRIGTRTIGLEQVVERALRLNGRRIWQTLESSLGIEYDLRSFGDTTNRTAYINPRRSSPVNLARLLLWTGVAYELGSIGTMELAGRMELTMVEMRKLHRSTGERQKPYTELIPAPLVPPFILQAENGNLAGHLYRLKQFCPEIVERTLFDERVLKGLADTISLMNDGLTRISITSTGEGVVRLGQLSEEIEMCAAFLSTLVREKAPRSLAAWRRIFATLDQRAVLVEVALNVLSEKYSAKNIVELGFWTNSLTRQVQGLSADLRLFAPWTSVRTAPLTVLIRRYDASALARWKRIIERLNEVSAISRLPKTLDAVLIEIAQLSDQLEQLLPSHTDDRATLLDGCARLKSALEMALRTSNDMRSRYARLTNQSAAIMKTIDFGFLFDEEGEAMRNRFPNRTR